MTDDGFRSATSTWWSFKSPPPGKEGGEGTSPGANWVPAFSKHINSRRSRHNEFSSCEVFFSCNIFVCNRSAVSGTACIWAVFQGLPGRGLSVFLIAGGLYAMILPRWLLLILGSGFTSLASLPSKPRWREKMGEEGTPDPHDSVSIIW